MVFAQPLACPRIGAYAVLLALTLAGYACSASSPTARGGGGARSAAAATPTSSAASGAVAPPSASGAGASANANGSLLVAVSMPVSSPASAGAGGTAAAARTNRDPIQLDECGPQNPGGIPPAEAQALKAGGAPGALKLIYPYEGTVFPRGMLAPDVMWQGAAATSVYVHIQSKIFEYSGCLKPTAEGRLTLPQDIWDQAGARTFGRDDVYTLELTVASKGTVAGPVKLTFNIAQATIKGSIYYNSYSSQLGNMAATGGNMANAGFFGGGAPMGGLVLRIPAGGKAELFGETTCNGCHSVSADGSRLLTQAIGSGGQSYELAASGMAGTPSAAGPRGAFGALYPDGSAYLSGSSVVEVARSNMTSQGQAADATLHDAKTGQVIQNVGVPKGALMPMLSADGTVLVFNDYAIDTAHGLAGMKYDVKTHTASEYKVLMKEPATGQLRPGWPFVLPDNGALVFVRTDGTDWSGNGAGVMAQGGPQQQATAAPFSELSILDLGSGTVTLLAKAMGYPSASDAVQGTTYLPFGAEELHHNYFPTVSPVAAGGYFWVFFDSVRHYGVLGSGRQLWGAAIDISPDGTYKADPSHPAFFLPGQELGTGNHRAFAALDPCRKDGDKCTSGIDCCGGFCYIDGPQEFDPVGSCTPKKMMCAKRDERCLQDSDCCPPEPGEQPNTCIAGFCAFIAPLN